jgi:hypothetical protein
MNSQQRRERAAMHEAQLLDRYQSPILGSEALRTILGFRTGRAFQIAARCERLPVPTFFQPGRRGRFARVSDLADWLARIDEAAVVKKCPDRKGNIR